MWEYVKAKHTHTHTHTHTLYEPATPFLVIYLKEMCTCILKVMHKNVHSNINQKTLQDSRKDKLIGTFKQWHVLKQ